MTTTGKVRRRDVRELERQRQRGGKACNRSPLGIDPLQQCGYDTQYVACPSHTLSMGEGRGGGKGDSPAPS
jgi:hypothetical protein